MRDKSGQYDAIIIGAGVGGSNTAAELSAAGWRCLIIEAGAYLDRDTYPRNEFEGNSRLFWNGGFELNQRADINVLRAKVVGGGSIVNQALLDEFDDVALDDWRERTGMSLFTQDNMRPWYDQAHSALVIQEIPEHLANKNAQIFKAGFAANGYVCAPLKRAQSNCRYEDKNDCIECLYGCRIDSKQSTPVASLKRALMDGCQIAPNTQVDAVQEDSQGVTVVLRHQTHGTRTVRAPVLVLAAGTLGSNHLLLKSGYADKLPALGHGFYGHPQWMHYALYDEPINAHQGTFQSYKSADVNFRKAGFKLENVYAPPIANAMLTPCWARKHSETMMQMNHYASIEVAIRDTNPGRLSLGKNNSLLIDKNLNAEDKRRAQKGYEAVRNIFNSTGAKEIFSGRLGIMLHSMGGLALANDPQKGCVDEGFKLFGSKRIWVADASVYPSAPGQNPSYTLMAMARYAAQQIIGSVR